MGHSIDSALFVADFQLLNVANGCCNICDRISIAEDQSAATCPTIQTIGGLKTSLSRQERIVFRYTGQIICP